MITFIVEPPLEAGQMYQVEIAFSGLLRNDSLYGFYASKYKDSNNNTKYVTQETYYNKRTLYGRLYSVLVRINDCYPRSPRFDSGYTFDFHGVIEFGKGPPVS